MTTQLSVTVRASASGDAAAVQSLWDECRLTRATDAEWSALTDGATGEILVAEHEGRVVGVAVATYDGWRAYIYHVAVQEDVRHRGVGLALMKEAEQYLLAAGARHIHLAVNEENTEGLALAVSSGYLPEGERVLVKTLRAQ